MRRSPQLEGFKAKGIEVLLLTDPIDEFWLPSVAQLQGQAVQVGRRRRRRSRQDRGRPARRSRSRGRQRADAELDRLIAVLKEVLKDTVKDVRVSSRLTESAVCLVAAEGDMDMYLERLLRQHRQLRRRRD